ncbi:hypothetical protein ACOSQ4_030814 [Xanthoceras sorbifolium]
MDDENITFLGQEEEEETATRSYKEVTRGGGGENAARSDSKQRRLMRKRWVSTNSHSWLGFDNAIPEGVGSWALDPFGPGEHVMLGRGLVNLLIPHLVEVLGPFFVTYVTPSEYSIREFFSTSLNLHFTPRRFPFRHKAWI